ncbi:unnamed protein product [Amoebophrya sp. A25]|nr:unnamed protein product [Amoebophrya sp. A25]|eukprot:GSA25T00011935001.1
MLLKTSRVISSTGTKGSAMSKTARALWRRARICLRYCRTLTARSCARLLLLMHTLKERRRATSRLRRHVRRTCNSLTLGTLAKGGRFAWALRQTSASLCKVARSSTRPSRSKKSASWRRSSCHLSTASQSHSVRNVFSSMASRRPWPRQQPTNALCLCRPAPRLG